MVHQCFVGGPNIMDQSSMMSAYQQNKNRPMILNFDLASMCVSTFLSSYSNLQPLLQLLLLLDVNLPLWCNTVGIKQQNLQSIFVEYVVWIGDTGRKPLFVNNLSVLTKYNMSCVEHLAKFISTSSPELGRALPELVANIKPYWYDKHT